MNTTFSIDQTDTSDISNSSKNSTLNNSSKENSVNMATDFHKTPSAEVLFRSRRGKDDPLKGGIKKRRLMADQAQLFPNVP